MFIKKVKKQNGRTAKVYEYLQLVESVRTEKGPRQKLILNLGNIDIDRSQYKALARRIEDILTGQKSFEKIDNKVKKYADKAAEKIFQKQAKEKEEQQQTDFKNIDVNSLESIRHRSQGAEYVCHNVWEELGMNKFLTGNDIPETVLPVIEALVVGRLVEPGSERHTRRWAQNRSAIYELTGKPLRDSLNSYYRAGDRLFSLKDSIEEYLSETESDMFSLKEKMVFIDLTNTYFEGEALKNPKARRGRSKEKRSDCKLVALGLVVNECGFVKNSKLFEGNKPEGETLPQMIAGLRKDAASEDITVVLDAGIASEDNLKWLRSKRYHYVVVSRSGAPVEIDYSQLKVLKEDKKKDMKIEVKRYEHLDEAYLVCRSRRKIKKEESMRKRVEELFLDRLKYYKSGLTIPRRTKRYVKVIEMIGRLKEKYPGAAKLYDVQVIPEEKKSKNISAILTKEITWEKKELREKEIVKEGTYILRTDRLDLSDNEIWDIYRMLGKIEDSFRSMKSHLGLRPNYHQIEKRADAHMFISVLAYHISNIIEHRLISKGDNRNWATIRDVLETHERLTIAYKSKEDGEIKQNYIRTNSTLEFEHQKIYRRLDLSGNPLPRLKMSN